MKIFAEHPLSEFLEQRRQAVVREIQSEPQDNLLNVNEADYVRTISLPSHNGANGSNGNGEAKAVASTPEAILAAVQFGDWLHPLMVVGLFALVQFLEGFVISPKIIGDRVGLHPLTIIIAVMVGTTLLGGITGGILAIPLTAALRVLMFRYVWRKPGDPTINRRTALS